VGGGGDRGERDRSWVNAIEGGERKKGNCRRIWVGEEKDFTRLEEMWALAVKGSAMGGMKKNLLSEMERGGATPGNEGGC